MSTPLIGGRGGTLSVSGESGEHGVYRSPPQKNKKNGVAQVGRQVWRDPCRGIPFRYAKIIKNAARCTK